MFNFLQILSNPKNTEQPVNPPTPRKYEKDLQDQEEEISPLYFHPSRKEVVQQYYAASGGDQAQKYNYISR